jgi:hypothetical protein
VIKAFSFDFGLEADQPDFLDKGKLIVQSLLMSLCPPHLEVYGVSIGWLRPFVMVGHAAPIHD